MAQRRDEIAERKQKRDFATAMIMEKELNAVCARFGWETKNITLDNAHVLRHPTPKYPLAARKEHLTGEGSFFLEIDTISGVVTHVTVSKSTGHAILDQAAIFALRQWRFAPQRWKSRCQLLLAWTPDPPLPQASTKLNAQIELCAP